MKKLLAAAALVFTGCATLPSREGYDTLAMEIRARAPERFLKEENCKVLSEKSYEEDRGTVQICFNLACSRTGYAVGCLAREATFFGGRSEGTIMDRRPMTFE